MLGECLVCCFYTLVTKNVMVLLNDLFGRRNGEMEMTVMVFVSKLPNIILIIFQIIKLSYYILQHS